MCVERGAPGARVDVSGKPFKMEEAVHAPKMSAFFLKCAFLWLRVKGFAQILSSFPIIVLFSERKYEIFSFFFSESKQIVLFLILINKSAVDYKCSTIICVIQHLLKEKCSAFELLLTGKKKKKVGTVLPETTCSRFGSGLPSETLLLWGARSVFPL